MKWGDPDELQQVWSTSEAGKTHACCAERWSKDNTPPTFEEAVTIAEPLLAGVNLPIPPNAQSMALATSWLDFPRSADGRNPLMLRWFIEEASSNRDYWGALKLIAAQLLRRGEQLPSDLSTWLADMLENERTLPRGRDGRPSTFRRKLIIVETVAVLVRLGMNPTRNVVTEPQHSACDAVVSALKRHGKYSQYRSIANIWERRDPSYRKTR